MASSSTPSDTKGAVDTKTNPFTSEPPLPPLPQDQVSTSPMAPTGQVPMDDIINTAPPPAYMSVDPNAVKVPIPTERPVPVGVNPSTTQKPENYVIQLKDLGETPDFVDCPHCHSRQKTMVKKSTNSQQGMAAFICCLCCGIIGGIIPLVFNWCADIDHICPHCQKTVAHMPYEGRMEPVLPNSNQGPGFAAGQFQPPTAPPK